jgi:hypothetical protein
MPYLITNIVPDVLKKSAIQSKLDGKTIQYFTRSRDIIFRKFIETLKTGNYLGKF